MQNFVLSAAAWTYVAAAMSAIGSWLFYIVLMLGSRGRRIEWTSHTNRQVNAPECDFYAGRRGWCSRRVVLQSVRAFDLWATSPVIFSVVCLRCIDRFSIAAGQWPLSLLSPQRFDLHEFLAFPILCGAAPEQASINSSLSGRGGNSCCRLALLWRSSAARERAAKFRPSDAISPDCAAAPSRLAKSRSYMDVA